MPHFEGVVLPEWIDANGHMNLAYYVVLFDQATDLLYDMLGVGQAYRDATGNSTFTAETHTLYEREVRVGERVRVVPHLLGADAKRLHYFHEMFHAEGGHRVAAQELIALHIDLSVRRVAPFPGGSRGAAAAGGPGTRRSSRCRTAWDDGLPCQAETDEHDHRNHHASARAPRAGTPMRGAIGPLPFPPRRSCCW